MLNKYFIIKLFLIWNEAVNIFFVIYLNYGFENNLYRLCKVKLVYFDIYNNISSYEKCVF